MNTRSQASSATTVVLLTLCAGQFLMTLDSSVMNVSIATVAKDVGTDVTGIQTAITLYTLVMASLMITGGKIGELIGRRRAFQIGCVIYGVGSFTTAIAPNLAVLLIGWSFLEGVGAALIMPAIVALVASNFPPRRPPAGLRAGRLGRRHRRCRRSAHRRVLHDVPVVAARVRRGSDRRPRHPVAQPQDGGRAALGRARPPRPRRHRAVGHRDGPHRLRGPPRRRLGCRASPSRTHPSWWACLP